MLIPGPRCHNFVYWEVRFVFFMILKLLLGEEFWSDFAETSKHIVSFLSVSRGCAYIYIYIYIYIYPSTFSNTQPAPILLQQQRHRHDQLHSCGHPAGSVGRYVQELPGKALLSKRHMEGKKGQKQRRSWWMCRGRRWWPHGFASGLAANNGQSATTTYMFFQQGLLSRRHQCPLVASGLEAAVEHATREEVKRWRNHRKGAQSVHEDVPEATQCL